MSISETNQAVAITRPGDPDVLVRQPWPMPESGPGDVLVRVAAAGVNGPDLAQRRGHYDPPPGASPLPGLEVSGEIIGIGAAVTGWQLGDRVMALTNGGGYADFVAVPAGQVLPVPDGWSLADAAALPETWFTVTQTLVMRARLTAGMNVLIHGAAGGIGGAAIQIACILGAKAIAVVSSDEKAAYARALGAHATINYKTEDIAARALALTDGAGVDRVLDIIGGAMAITNITASGTKAAIADHIRTHLLPTLARPDFVRPRVTCFPIADAAAAHRAIEGRNHLGKLVLLTPFGAAN